MIKKVVIYSCILLFILLLTPTVYAYTWHLLSKNEYWDICQFGHWKFIGNGEGIAHFRVYNVSHDIIYHGVLNVSDLTALKPSPWWAFWEFGWEKNFQLRFNFSLDNGAWFCFIVEARHVVSFWGHSQDYILDTNFRINATSWAQMAEWGGWDKYSETVWQPNEKVEFFVEYNRQTGRVKIKFFNWANVDGQGRPMTWTIPNVSPARPHADYVGSANSFNITLTVYHWGNGRIEAHYYDEFETFYFYPEARTIREEGLSGVANIPYVGSFLAALIKTMDFVLVMITGVIVTVVRFGLPLTPIIILFWFLDAMLTSVIEGDVKPIGALFTTIYNFFVMLIQTIANIISGLVDAIKWW